MYDIKYFAFIRVQHLTEETLMGIKPIINDKKLIAKLMSGRTGQMKSYIAILLVSVGKENFEDEALKSALKMINQEFKGCCITIADTLQRYNIATENHISAQSAYHDSLQNGDKWLEKYKPCFEEILEIPYEIMRWDTLISSPDFIIKENSFSLAINHISKLQQAMNHSIDEYGERLKKRLGENEFNAIFLQHKEHCFSYLKEECIAITLLPKHITLAESENMPIAIVYPGKSTSILNMNRELFIQTEFSKQMTQHQDYLNWLVYRFNRVNTHDLIQQGKKAQFEADKKNVFSNAEQIDYINNLSEAQVYSIYHSLNDASILAFNTHVLDYLLGSKKLTDDSLQAFIDNQSYLSPHLLAYIFSTQILALLNKLEPHISNQCKANIVRILKRNCKPETLNGVHNKFEQYHLSSDLAYPPLPHMLIHRNWG